MSAAADFGALADMQAPDDKTTWLELYIGYMLLTGIIQALAKALNGSAEILVYVPYRFLPGTIPTTCPSLRPPQEGRSHFTKRSSVRAS